MGKKKPYKPHGGPDDIEGLKKDLGKSRAKGDFKEVGNLHNQIGILYRELGLYDEALQEHDEEAAVTRRYFPDDLLGLGVALRAKGEVYLEMKEEEKALPLIRNYLCLSLEAGDLVEEQRAHVTLGRVFLGMALKRAEEDGKEKEEALRMAEEEFSAANQLTNHHKVRSSESELGLVDMKCGVYQNISLVLELRGKREESRDYLLKTVELAKRHSLYEHLHRTHLNLYEIAIRAKVYPDAVTAAEEVAKAAKTLGKKDEEAEALLLQAKAFFLLDNVEGGIKILKKARKCVQNNTWVKEELNPILQAAVRVSRTEDKLHATMDNRQKTKLYEILGDKYVELGNFRQAANNYELAIQNGEECCVGVSKLGQLYFSLAETLNDLGEHVRAVRYLRKEISLQTNPREAFKTQTILCLTLEKAKAIEEDVSGAHLETIRVAKELSSPRKEAIGLTNYAAYLRTNHKEREAGEALVEAEELRSRYNLNTDSEEVDSQEDLLAGGESDSGSSIDLDQLTSEEENEDEEPKNISTKKRKFRTNEKGETPLHVAAKKGDLKGVRRLLRQGHEVNPRDSAGWLPLHEATNFGHVEVVKELLAHGARINDQPGGRDCDRITPLHDAANNGHCHVMEVLLAHGASAILKDANGNYPIDSLVIWGEGAKTSGFSEEESVEFENMKELLRRKMAEGGKIYRKDEERNAKKKARNTELKKDEMKFELLAGKSSKESPIPIRVIADDFDPDQEETAVDLYSSAMRSLRGKTNRHSDEERDEPKVVAPALIAETDYVDEDWLEDDMGRRKRKREFIEEPLTRDRTRRRRNNLAKFDIPDMPEEANENPLQLRTISPVGTSISSASSSPQPLRRQKSLQIDEDEAEIWIESPSTPIVLVSDDEEEGLKRKGRVVQTKLPFKVIPAKKTGWENSNPYISTGLEEKRVSRLKIQIGGKTFVVPLEEDQLDEKIDWLAIQAANRYAESEGVKPILRISTSDGALLSGNDRIRLAVGGIETLLQGEILSLDLPRLTERFQEALQKHPDLPLNEVEDILRRLEISESSDDLSLVDIRLSEERLRGALCQCLQWQGIRSLDLSGTCLLDGGLKVLGPLLHTLPHLQTLNLSLNGITADGIRYLSDANNKPKHFTSEGHSRGLVSLNLSFNPLGNSSGGPITDFLSGLYGLRNLYLIDSGFTDRLLAESKIINILSRLKLEELDLRYNYLGRNGMMLLLNSGALERMKKLNGEVFDDENPFQFL